MSDSSLATAEEFMHDRQGVRLIKAVSRLFGWIYTLSWSLSFYPQPILNWQRRATTGLAIDFPTVNVLGFVSYTISTACFLYSPVIRQQYAARHPVSREPTVRFNDLAFGVHAILLTVLTFSQFFPVIWGFKVSSSQRVSKPIAGILWGSIGSVVLVIVIVLFRTRAGPQDPLDWAWIDVIYTFGYIKLLITFVKYIPQVWVNYKRKSTEGWSIAQILFDFTGGILSLLQLVIDSSFQDDWSGLTGNPVKLGLANISMCFDLIFITQHYFLYRQVREGKLEDEDEDGEGDDDRQPLLNSR